MLHVTHSKRDPVEVSSFPEMVERKGKGHPDSVCDAIAEACSRTLSNYYLDHYNQYFHLNLDKAAYVAGQAKPIFGGGEILQPQEFEIIGRAIDSVIINGNLHHIPVRPILRKTIREVFQTTFRNLNPDKHVVIDARTKSGSFDLTHLYEKGVDVNKKNLVPLANDTSFGVGFAPLSTTEQIVYKIETFLNSDQFKDQCPASGEDIKVMGLRYRDNIEITLCNALISKFVPDLSTYKNIVAQIQEAALRVGNEIKGDHTLKVVVNTADDFDKDIYFLTITGTSAEAGDDGQVGRGNRANGLITPGRVQTLEAAAGKNSNNHVGKLYSLVANRVAHQIYEAAQGDILDCQIRIVSQIGHPINEPWFGDIAIIPAPNTNFDQLANNAKDILQTELDNYKEFRKDLLAGNIKVW
jgi:S-adenosylmethionine synthetase